MAIRLSLILASAFFTSSSTLSINNATSVEARLLSAQIELGSAPFENRSMLWGGVWPEYPLHASAVQSPELLLMCHVKTGWMKLFSEAICTTRDVSVGIMA